jgi:hypothetical protein
MYQEALKLRNYYIHYRSTDTYDQKGWYSLPIIGKSEKEPYSWDHYKYQSAKDAAFDMKLTEISEHCPITVDWLKNTYPSSQYARVRFMLLESGGKIEFHKDTNLSILGAVNIALNNPKNCKWIWRDDETLEFNPGDAYAMNLSYEHSVVNDSEIDRYHLIVHHYDSIEDYKNMIIRSMEKSDVKGNFHYSQELF